MRISPRRFIATFATVTTMLSGVAIAPVNVRADESADATKAEAIAQMDANLDSLQKQAAEIGGQIGELNGEISKLQTEYRTLEKRSETLWDAILEAMKDNYVVDSSSTSLDAVVSSQSLSELFSSEQYRTQVNEDLQNRFEEYVATKEKIDKKLAEAKEKRQGALDLQSQVKERQETAAAQEAARQAAAALSEKQFQAAKAAEEKADVEGIANAAPGRPGNNGGGGSPQPIGGGRSGNPYPYGQCTWYVYDQTGRGQNGNAGTWQPSSSTPGVGKIMIWRPGEQGAAGAGHVGVVIGVNGNSVTVRHMNWNGFGVVSTGTFRSTGKFY